MKTTVTFLSFFLLNAIFSFSQTNENWRLFPAEKYKKNSSRDTTTIAVDTVKEIIPTENTGIITIKKDPRIDELSKELGTPKDGVSVKIYGYRLQIIVSSSKEKVDNERTKLLESNPNLTTYIDYRQPNFRLKVGDFESKLEAQKIQHELKYLFPSAIVVVDMIELPKIKIEETEEQ